jgi:hypothetical protein
MSLKMCFNLIFFLNTLKSVAHYPAVAALMGAVSKREILSLLLTPFSIRQ